MEKIIRVSEVRSKDTLVEVAQWSAANAIGNLESEWLTKGREAL
jgi:hypothetical protein